MIAEMIVAVTQKQNQMISPVFHPEHSPEMKFFILLIILLLIGKYTWNNNIMLFTGNKRASRRFFRNILHRIIGDVKKGRLLKLFSASAESAVPQNISRCEKYFTDRFI